ncbi:MAG TPA: hypothetical protein VNN62_03385 [Methylomirabilota bacterium]|nr:hypothetical protein [Methylomirabilota bacterium]
MQGRAQARNWGYPAAAVIIMMYGGIGCVTVSSPRAGSCAPSAACPSVIVCASPASCPQSSPSQGAPAGQPESAQPSAAAAAQPAPAPPAVFPPRTVLESGDYDEFVKENEQKVRDCKKAEAEGCDIALFNLGFAYAYAASPYRNLTKAAVQFDTLNRLYPESPYTLPAQVWRGFILERLTLEEDLRAAQTNLRSKEAMIRTLQEQIERLRALDIEMQKKERELLQLR